MSLTLKSRATTSSREFTSDPERLGREHTEVRAEPSRSRGRSRIARYTRGVEKEPRVRPLSVALTPPRRRHHALTPRRAAEVGFEPTRGSAPPAFFLAEKKLARPDESLGGNVV